jgi:hypothetical protein
VDPITSPESGSAAEWLRRAAAVLREQLRELPHGPWRWADPDIGSGGPPDDIAELGRDPGRALGSTPVHPSGIGQPPLPGWRDPAFAPPMSTFEDVGHPARSRVPVGARPVGGIAPAIAEPLATLLDQLARQVEQGDQGGAGGEEDVEQAAVAVAKIILELTVPPSDRGYA